MANQIKGLSASPKVEPRPNKKKEFRWSVRVKYKGVTKDFASGNKSKDRADVPPQVITHIHNIENWLISAYRQAGMLQEEFDFKSEFDNIKRIISGGKPKDKKASPLILDLIDEKLESIEKENSAGKLITLRNHIETFRPTLTAEEIKPIFKKEFLQHLEQHKLQSSTLRQLFAQLSGTMSFAFNAGKLVHNNYTFLKVKGDKGNEEKQCFTRGEYFLFNHLMRYVCVSFKESSSLPFDLTNNNFEALSHLYLACLTGLRHSDLKALKGKPLTIQSELNKHYFVVGTSKTNKTVKIPLSNNAVWFIKFKKTIKPLPAEYYSLNTGLEKIHKASLEGLRKPTNRPQRSRVRFKQTPLEIDPNALVNSPNHFKPIRLQVENPEDMLTLQERLEIYNERPITEWGKFIKYFGDNLAGGIGNGKIHGAHMTLEEFLDTEVGKNWQLAEEESLNSKGFLSRIVHQTKVYTDTNKNETLSFPYWEKCSYHDGRRFFGSIWYHNTKDIDRVQKLLGHTTPSETSGYIVRWEEEKEEVDPLDIV